jgi:hypothetical protein
MTEVAQMFWIHGMTPVDSEGNRVSADISAEGSFEEDRS